MKKLFALLLAVVVLTTLIACHKTDEKGPQGEGLYPIVTHPSDTAGREETEPSQDPTIPYGTMPTTPSMPSNPGDNVPVPSDPTNPENNKQQ